MFSKYFPTKKELNKKYVNGIEKWLQLFSKTTQNEDNENINKLKKINMKKPLLVYGDSGIGKTYLVKTILTENNYNIKYFNSNDFLNKSKNGDEDIKIKVQRYLTNYFCSFDMINFLSVISKQDKTTKQITLQKKILVVDESLIFNFYQLNVILTTLLDVNKNNEYPIIFILNSKHNKFLNNLKKKTTLFYIESSINNEMINFVNKICIDKK